MTHAIAAYTHTHIHNRAHSTRFSSYVRREMPFAVSLMTALIKNANRPISLIRSSTFGPEYETASRPGVLPSRLAHMEKLITG